MEPAQPRSVSVPMTASRINTMIFAFRSSGIHVTRVSALRSSPGTRTPMLWLIPTTQDHMQAGLEKPMRWRQRHTDRLLL